MKKIFPLYLVLAFFMASVAFPAVGMAASFPDTTGHWAEEYIISLANAGYISGYPDGTFKPDKVVSRAEFVTVLVQCMGSSPGTGSSGFADTSRHWAKGYIAQAVALGILIPEEYPTGLSPDGGIKRSECAAMLVRALGEQPDYSTLPFTDKETVNRSMYRGYVKTAYNLGLLSGFPDGSFQPFQEVTRAQMSKVMTGFLEKTDSTIPGPVNPGVPTTGSITSVAVEEEIYPLSDGITLVADNREVKVTSLSASQGELLVNNQYRFDLERPEKLAMKVFSHYIGIREMTVSGDRLVVYPEYRKVTSITMGSRKYDPYYVNLYVNYMDDKRYLSELNIIDEYTVILDRDKYDLSRDKVTIELGRDFYDISRIDFDRKETRLQLTKTDAVVIGELSMANISAIFAGNNSLDLNRIRTIDFIIKGERYRMMQVRLDGAGNFIVNNTTYPANQVQMIADGMEYDINFIQVVKGKFVFYCTEGSLTGRVMINNSYYDPEKVQILKDNVAYDMDDIIVLSRNYLRIAGKQYDLRDAKFQCKFDGKLHDIKWLDYDNNLQMVTMEVKESIISQPDNQPGKFVFFEGSSKIKDGTSGVTIYAGRRWANFSSITILDPLTFSFEERTYKLIGAIVTIGNTDYEIVDTSWHGASKILDLYLKKI